MTAHADDLSMAQQVDACCDRFEAMFNSGQRPRIDDFLVETSEQARSQLFRSLLELEIELRSRAGETPQRDDYTQHFADQIPVIESVFAGASNSLSGYLQTRVIESDSQHQPEALAREGSSVNSVGADTFRSSTQSSDTVTLAPTSVGRFQILQQLGEGAFGTVYRARDPQLDREVAIKVPRAGTLTQDERDRFLREARAAAGLHHPLICAVHEVGTTADGRDYLVMAFIDGKPLSKVLQNGQKLTDRQITGTIRKIAQALAEAHQKGVIHRDLKPANVMINRKGDPVIMDFGLARRLSASDPQLSVHGQIMGTPAYMSPEQARGDSPAIGPAADIYSLGIIMYEMLCGQRPFSGTVTEVIGQILHVEAPPPSQFRDGIDPRLQAICMQAIAKNPADRFSSMKAFAAALATALTDQHKSSLATPPSAILSPTSPDSSLGSTPAAAARAVRRASPRWLALFASGIVGLGLMLGIVFFVWNQKIKVSVSLDVDVHDPKLGFYLDGNNLDGAKLAGEIELTPGNHRLLVLRENQVYRDYQLRVVKGQKTAEIAVIATAPDLAPPPAPPPVKTVPTEKDEGYVDLFNGKDLSGWESDTDASSFSVNEQERELIAGPIAANSKLRRHWLFTREDYSDYILRLEFFPIDEKVKGAVAIKGKMGSDPLYNIELAIQVRDPITGPRRAAAARPTGTLIINGVDGVTPASIPKQKVDDWNSLEIKLQGSVVTVTLNDQLVQEVDMAKIDRKGLPKEAIENMDRRPARIGLQSMEGTMKYRHIRLRDLSAPPPKNNYRKAFGKHTYRFMNEMRTYQETLQRCERLSGRLAVVDSAEKNVFLAQMISEAGGQEAWLGIARQAGDGSWRTPAGQPLKYSNWIAREPARGMNHALLTKSSPDGQGGGWRAADDNHRAGFFIEWDLPTGTDLVVPAGAADRKAAEYVLSVGGRVLVDGRQDEIASLDKLPAQPFQLTNAILEFNKKVTDEGLANFQGCRHLKAIDLDRDNVSEAGLVHFQNCRQLKSLNLIATKTNDAALEYFRDCRSLSHVWLINAPVTDSGIACLSACDRLEVFDVAGTKVTDAGLAFLKNNRDLELLSVSWTTVSDKGLAHVRGCQKLRRLYLVDSKITDIGLADFQGRELAVLDLTGTAITDEGLAPFLNCKTLKSLKVKRTNVSANLIQRFRAELPSCQIE